MTILEFAIEGIKQAPQFSEYRFEASDDPLIAHSLLSRCPDTFVSTISDCEDISEELPCTACWLREVPEGSKFGFYHLYADRLIEALKHEFDRGGTNIPVQKMYNGVDVEFGVVEPDAESHNYMEKCDKYHTITQELCDLHARKSADYGDSFHQTFLEEGWAAPRLRLNDKMNRIKQLTKNGEAQVKDESLRDSLLDLASYAILSIMEIDNANTD